jgi:hypothetical protein
MFYMALRRETRGCPGAFQTEIDHRLTGPKGRLPESASDRLPWSDRRRWASRLMTSPHHHDSTARSCSQSIQRCGRARNVRSYALHYSHPLVLPAPLACHRRRGRRSVNSHSHVYIYVYTIYVYVYMYILYICIQAGTSQWEFPAASPPPPPPAVSFTRRSECSQCYKRGDG